MRKSLMWLNLYDCQTVLCTIKLKAEARFTIQEMIFFETKLFFCHNREVKNLACYESSQNLSSFGQLLLILRHVWSC